jgi:hypothetical protein
LPLKDIALDERNPRIVTQVKLSSQQEILGYLFEHEDLESFIKKIASEGKNQGAERPYVVKTSSSYTVIEGNTRIAAYKILTGVLTPPKEFAVSVTGISKAFKSSLLSVDCSIAPSRDALLPIMASAHFGLGDKSKWGYLGSRKAVYDEWKAGKTIPKLAKAFDRTPGQIKELILEYLLYLKALALHWTSAEKKILLMPSVEFNPPVRFLQSKGHKEKVGINYDTANLKVTFSGAEAEKKFKHLLKQLVLNPQRGLGATATYDEVFTDYGMSSSASKSSTASGAAGTSAGAGTASASGSTSGAKSSKSSANTSQPLKPGALFAYPVTMTNALLTQLMRESKDINSKKFPAAATFLLRNIVETILKHIIDLQKANPASKTLDLESAITLCMSNSVSMGMSDKKILKEFLKNYVNYLNLGAHGNVIPNQDMVAAARDCIDQFVKKNV